MDCAAFYCTHYQILGGMTPEEIHRECSDCPEYFGDADQVVVEVGLCGECADYHYQKALSVEGGMKEWGRVVAMAGGYTGGGEKGRKGEKGEGSSRDQGQSQKQGQQQNHGQTFSQNQSQTQYTGQHTDQTSTQTQGQTHPQTPAQNHQQQTYCKNMHSFDIPNGPQPLTPTTILHYLNNFPNWHDLPSPYQRELYDFFAQGECSPTESVWGDAGTVEAFAEYLADNAAFAKKHGIANRAWANLAFANTAVGHPAVVSPAVGNTAVASPAVANPTVAAADSSAFASPVVADSSDSDSGSDSGSYEAGSEDEEEDNNYPACWENSPTVAAGKCAMQLERGLPLPRLRQHQAPAQGPVQRQASVQRQAPVIVSSAMARMSIATTPMGQVGAQVGAQATSSRAQVGVRGGGQAGGQYRGESSGEWSATAVVGAPGALPQKYENEEDDGEEYDDEEEESDYEDAEEDEELDAQTVLTEEVQRSDRGHAMVDRFLRNAGLPTY